MDTASRFFRTLLRSAALPGSAGASRSLAIAALFLGLTACGGGGGGGSGESTLPTPSGLRVTVSDIYGAKIAGATVEATIGTTVVTGTTNVDGVATMADGTPVLIFRGVTGTASVIVSRDTFVTQPATAEITANQLTELSVTLDRATSAAGGSLTSRSGTPPSVAPGAQSMTFEIELVIVDGQSRPITGLDAANFVLRACTPDPGNDRVDCVRGAAADFDASYVPATGIPVSIALIPGAAAQPYAAALMLDQSGSIATSDPTGARLYSAKAFIDGIGTEDRVLLSAFANGAALIPDIPLTLYPPFRDSATVSDEPSYFSTLDSLPALVGGSTPLYAALDLMREQLVTDASLPDGIAKSLVIFTDGDDTDCGDANACRTRRQESIDAANTAGVRVFTIGLSSGVNFEALGELANQTGGAFLFADSPEQLIPLYGSVGRLLSLSLPTYRLRWTVQAEESGIFLPGNAILGRVEVSAGGSKFEVPFIVGIP
ncbi:MAG: vWA domain-containing protein [Thiobacillus sp.]